MTTAPDLRGLQTESRNPRSTEIDNVSTLELCNIINHEDGSIPDIVKACIPTIANAIDALAPRVQRGGRVVYVGAGTSGRLGVLDASEIPPTYSAPPSQFVGLIAGGDVALRSAKEGAEDSLELAIDDLKLLDLDGEKDSLIGIASSGRTPYVLSCLAFARSKGCVTVGIACTAPSAMSTDGNVDFMIEAVTGPEAVTGSTRMKAGTATKLILNMLSTGIMIKIGKTYGNIMVDVKPTNVKLQIRARRILREIGGDRCPDSDEELDRELLACSKNVKLTAVKIYLGVSVDEAERRLRAADGVLANLLKAPQIASTSHTDPKTQVASVNGVENEYVICIDGGGSKCSAIIMSDVGALSRGEAGPCNPTDVGIQGAVSAIQTAVQNAIDSCEALQGRDIREVRVREVWVGLAGGDRKAIGSPIRTELRRLLGDRNDMNLTVSNDLDLLATASGHQYESDDVIVLVAGTGSIAMRYGRNGHQLCRTARAGGWGGLLGDDGSGFDIGRKAIRAALFVMEEQEINDASPDPDPLLNLVCQHFRLTVAEANDSNLLNNIILSAAGDEQTVSQTKRKIASCTKVVTAGKTYSKLAEDIVGGAADSLVHLVRTVLRKAPTGKGDPVLILAGGLMNSTFVTDRLMSKLDKNDLRHKFSSIRIADDPAAIGAQFLARRAWQRDDRRQD